MSEIKSCIDSIFTICDHLFKFGLGLLKVVLTIFTLSEQPSKFELINFEFVMLML